jgi:hypothetical protein
MSDLDINVVANGEGVIIFIPFPINGPDATWEACAANPTYTLEYQEVGGSTWINIDTP